MSTAELKEHIIQMLISTEDESKLLVIYNALKEDNYQLTNSQKKELEKRIADRKAGKTKQYSWQEVQERLNSI